MSWKILNGSSFVHCFLFEQDYDPLNSGRIAPQQFRRAMDAMGLGAVLSPEEVVCVLRHYLDPNDGQRVCWRTFEDDCDQGIVIFMV